MEAASPKLRTIVAILATIVMGAAMVQTIAPAPPDYEPKIMPGGLCPPEC